MIIYKMWIYFVANLIKCYLGINLGVSLIKLGVDAIIAGLKLLIV
jgi:hypothetical protein